MGAAHRGAGLMSEAAVAVSDWALAADAAGFRRIEPADPTVPTRDGASLPAWHAVRTVPADPLAFESWADVLGSR